jgi:hypothetical protein
MICLQENAEKTSIFLQLISLRRQLTIFNLVLSVLSKAGTAIINNYDVIVDLPK